MEKRMRCYKFGIRFEEKLPEPIGNQLRGYGELYNKCIEVHCKKREAYRELRRKHWPEYESLENEMTKLCEAIEQIKVTVKARTQSEWKKNKNQPKAAQPTDIEAATLKDLRKKREPIKERMQQMREDMKHDKEWNKLAADLDETYKIILRKLMTDHGCNPYTGDMVAKAAAQANKHQSDPDFRKFRGEGRIGVQFHANPLTEEGQVRYKALKQRYDAYKELKKRFNDKEIDEQDFNTARVGLLDRKAYKTASDGLPRKDVWQVGDLFTSANTKLRIERPQLRAKIVRQGANFVDDGKFAKRRAPVRGQICVDQSKKIWVDFTLTPQQLKANEQKYADRLHPGLADDFEIKEAYISRQKIGQIHESHLCLVVKEPAPEPARSTRLLAIRPGPIQKVDRDGITQIRIATLFDGERVFEWFLPKVPRTCYTEERGKHVKIIDPIDVFEHVDDIKSIEKTCFDAMRGNLIKWIQANKAKIPPWLHEMLPKIKHRKFHPARMVALVKRTWKANRFEGDEAIFEKLYSTPSKRTTDDTGAGIRTLLHLYNWWSNEQRGAIGWRNHYYKQLAFECLGAKVADADQTKRRVAAFGEVVIADLDLAKQAKRPKNVDRERDKDTPDPVRTLRTRVALSCLINAVTSAATNVGAVVEKQKKFPLSADAHEDVRRLYHEHKTRSVEEKLNSRFSWKAQG